TGMGMMGLAVAGLFAAASTSFVVSLGHSTVAEVLIALSTAPFIAALIARLLLAEPIRPRTLATMIMALVGMVIMMSNSIVSCSLVGDVLALLSAVCYAAAVVVVRRGRAVRMTPAATLAATLGAVFAAIMGQPFPVAAADLGMLALFGAVQMGFGLVLFTA